MARGDAGQRVAAAHGVAAAGRRRRRAAALARDVDLLAGVDEVRIADLRVGRRQRRQRHAVARGDARQRVAAAHGVAARRRAGARRGRRRRARLRGRGAAALRALVAEHLRLFIAAAHQARQHAAASVHELAELGLRTGVVAGVQLLEQRRAAQRPGAEVEGEAHQRVELALRERHLDVLAHRVLRPAHVLAQQLLGLRLGDLLARLGGAGVAVADGPHAHRVLVGGGAQALVALDQVQARLAQAHAGRLRAALGGRGAGGAGRRRRAAHAAGHADDVAGVDAVGVGDLWVGRDQRRQRHAAARGDGGQRVAVLHGDGGAAGSGGGGGAARGGGGDGGHAKSSFRGETVKMGCPR